jgi:hypothetical protein
MPRFLAARLTSLALAALLVLPAPAFAAAPPAVVAAVKAFIAESVTDGMSAEELADPVANPPWLKEAPAKMFKQVDINGDKLPDWKVDFGQAPNGSYFCGTGGCTIQLYLGQADGTWRMVFYNLVREFKMSGPKSARIIDVDFHGSVCGGFGVEECPRRYGWDSATGRLLERVNKKGSGLLRSGATPAMPLKPEDAPQAIRDELDRRDLACKAVKGTYDRNESTFLDIPDINGDGLRDWVVGTWDYCSFPDDAAETDSPALPLTVFVTGPSGLSKALEKTGVSWEIDIARTPMAFTLILESDACGLGSPCPREPQVWDPASGMLKPSP